MESGISKRTIGLIALSLIALLSACGGGGSSSASPPTITYANSPYTLTEGVAAQSIAPTVTGGTVTSWSITPVLPPGLSIDVMTGNISGTPTSLSPATTYVVSGGSAAGQATVQISIAVNAPAPVVAYPSPSYTYTANVPGTVIAATSSGGAVTGWSVNPALPAGLTLDASSGNLSGTPTSASAAATYVVTASNSGGSVNVSLKITVNSDPLLSLGHAVPVTLIRATSSRILSLDVGGHWTLEDYASGAELARGDGACGTNFCFYPTTLPKQIYPPVDMAASTVLDAAATGVEVRSASTGTVLATLPGSYSWYRLASDGSYVCAGNTTSLKAWDTAGHVLVMRSGDYSKANVFAAPGQIQVALGPVGQNLIETISTTTGMSSSSPAFQGQFSTWFLDGNRFLTTQSNVVFTYSSAAAPLDITQLSSTDGLNAQGNWFWTFPTGGGTLSIYKVGSSTAPAFSAGYGVDSAAIASNGTIGVLPYGSGQLVTIDLSGSTPVSSSTLSVPIGSLEVYAAIPGGSWVVGNADGVVFDGATIGAPQPRYLALGKAWSIAGGTSYFSVATASGRIFNYNTSTNGPAGTIDFPGLKLAASADGTVMAAAGNNVNNTIINVYSLPSGTVTNNFTSSAGPNEILGLSGDGSTLLGPISNTSGCVLEAIHLSGGGIAWCGGAIAGGYGNVTLSPDATLIAAADNNGGGVQQSTNIYKSGTLATAVPAGGLIWLDNGRLLARTTKLYSSQTVHVYNYNGAAIYDPTGKVLTTSNIPLPDIFDYALAQSNSVYSPTLDATYSLATGTATWASGDATTGPAVGLGVGAVAGTEVVFLSGAYVLTQQYQ